jgi:cysteine desulfurase
VKRNTPIGPIIYGGGQEGGLRSGTENLSAIAGFAKALVIAVGERFTQGKFLENLRAQFVDGLKGIRADIAVNGSGDRGMQSPHILNVSIPGIDNEFFLFQLDAKGIACSTKSSCLRDEDESYVLKAMGANSANSLRFSFGRWTTKGDVARTLKIISQILHK